MKTMRNTKTLDEEKFDIVLFDCEPDKNHMNS